jgi:hypothetical protein
MTFPSFHFTTLTYPSHHHHSVLPFTTLHFISLHFTLLHLTSLYFWMVSATPSLRLIFHFPNIFPKIAWNMRMWKRQARLVCPSVCSVLHSETNSTQITIAWLYWCRLFYRNDLLGLFTTVDWVPKSDSLERQPSRAHVTSFGIWESLPSAEVKRVSAGFVPISDQYHDL